MIEVSGGKMVGGLVITLLIGSQCPPGVAFVVGLLGGLITFLWAVK